MQPPVGIDLGTTYSLIAKLDESGRPVTLPNSAGELLTPSAVLFADGELVVGREAVKASVVEPDGYAECFKRDMGSLWYRHKVRGMEVPPEVLSAFVLERLKKDAEAHLGRVEKAVITVPAFFDEQRRKATQDAAQLAGLTVLDTINEPTAAAVNFGYELGLFNLAAGQTPPEPQRLVVYDLGGGTFDVTILEVHGTQFRALATDGDVQLGGKDFDERLVNHVAERFLAEHGVDPRSDPADAAQLWMDVEEGKHALSERRKTTIICFHAGIRMRIEVTRDEFEEMTRDLLERTETTTSLVIKDAGLTWTDIDRILLVGGATRMPMVSEMLRRVTGMEPDRSPRPDEAVAHGAALYAGMLMRQNSLSPSPPSCQLINVNSHSLGVVGLDQQTRQRVNLILIPKNTPLPYQVSRLFVTAKADQRSVMVPVVEGESTRPDECIALGKCVVRGLPPGLPAGTQVEVQYRYEANGRITVSARVPSTRQSAHVEIERTRQRNLEDLDSWRRKLQGLGEPASGGFAAADTQTVDPSDRAGVLKRLDQLYIHVGKAGCQGQLPEALARCQQAARDAAAALTEARSRVKQAEREAKQADTRSETIRLGAALAKAKSDLHHAQTQADFALLVLGRELVNAGHQPPGAERPWAEIRRLRQKLASA